MSPPTASLLDASQVLQHSFDDDLGALRTTASAIIVPTGAVNIIIASSADSVAIGNKEGTLTASLSVIGSSTALDTYVANGISLTSSIPLSVTNTVAVSGSALTATIANPLSITSIAPISVTAIIPLAVTNTVSVSGSALTAFIAGTANVNVVDSLAISSIVPVAVTNTVSVSGSALTATIAGTSDVNVVNNLAISSIVPVGVSGTVSVSGSALSATILNPLSITSIIPLAVTNTVSVSGSALTASISGTANVNVTNPLSVTSIVPIAVTNTVTVSGSALTATIANPLSVTSIVPVAVTNTVSVSGSALTATIANPLSITSIIPLAVTNTVAVSGSALTATISNLFYDYGTSASAIRTASQIGNSTGQAAFGAGTTNAQTLRTVIATDQSDIPVRLKDQAGSGLDSSTATDAITSNLRGLITKSENYLYNGTTWDAGRSAVIGTNVGSTGVAAVALYGKYSTTATTITSGNLAQALSDEQGVLLTKPDFAGYTLQNKVYSTSTTQVNIATTTETPLFLLKNPSGSTILIRLFKLLFLSPDGTAGHTITFRAYAMPTITANGTALTTINNRIKAAPTAGAAQAFRSPTISANGTLMFSKLKFGQNGDTVFDMENQIVIEANSHFLITGQGSVNNILMEVDAWWAEV